jgi:predicted GH43/DUF377 family glycosyl hydrolase
MKKLKLAKWQWQRDPRNPILAPDKASPYDGNRTMNPFVVRVGDQYRLYYAGWGSGVHRICLATAPVADPGRITRHGAVLEIGEKGGFDGSWCVLPMVYKFGDTWHLYYTGNDGGSAGLQSFRGLGLAMSPDGLKFERYSKDPIVTGDQTREFPTNKGIAGGAIVTEVQPDGSPRYRLYYTLTVGTPNKDRTIDQEKHSAVAHSVDGIHWTDHRVVLGPRRGVTTDDIAAAGPVVWRDGDVYRMLYSGIGTRWGYYSISEAVSADGYEWYRGEGDENLSLAPDPASEWEQQMVEYPAVIPEGDHLRLFYCGNGYGTTGIGTAVAPLRG